MVLYAVLSGIQWGPPNLRNYTLLKRMEFSTFALSGDYPLEEGMKKIM